MSDLGEFISDWSCGILNDLSELVLVWQGERCKSFPLRDRDTSMHVDQPSNLRSASLWLAYGLI